VVKTKAKPTKPARRVALQPSGNGEKRLGGCTGKGFMPGQSGNPTGKRKASVSPTAVLKRCLTRADAETIAETLIARAKAGDATAVKLLLDRIDGPQTGPLAVAMASATSETATGEIVVRWPHERALGTKAQVVLMDNGRGDRQPFDQDGYVALARQLYGVPTDTTPAQPPLATEPEPEGDAQPGPPGVVSGAEFLQSG
jgi:hypothetical protein